MKEILDGNEVYRPYAHALVQVYMLKEKKFRGHVRDSSWWILIFQPAEWLPSNIWFKSINLYYRKGSIPIRVLCLTAVLGVRQPNKNKNSKTKTTKTKQQQQNSKQNPYHQPQPAGLAIINPSKKSKHIGSHLTCFLNTPLFA